MGRTRSILQTALALRSGAAIAYPTDTVYGLGCLPTPEGLQRIIQIKRRSPSKGMILIGANREQLEPFTSLHDEQVWQQILRPRRRATTWIVPAASSAPELLTGRFTSVAIRLVRHRPTAALCTTCGSAIVSTSANESGQPPTKNYRKLSRAVLRQIDLLLIGTCGRDQQSSQIVDALTGRVIASRIR